MSQPSIREEWRTKNSTLTTEIVSVNAICDWWLSKFTTDLDELAGKLTEEKYDIPEPVPYPENTLAKFVRYEQVKHNISIDHALALIKNLREQYI